jgi:hypothetical protein
VIHLGVHLHRIVDCRCKETLYKTKKLIEEETNWTFDAKTFSIFFSTSKSFLAKHLFYDNGDDSFKLFKGN